MGRQWIRQLSLVVGVGNNEGIDLSQLRVNFHVTKMDIQSPNTATIRIYNVARETALRVQKEYTKVYLQVGYKGSDYGLLFAGQVRQVKRGRENPTDTYLDVLAADSDEAYNYAVVNTTLAAGATQADIVKTCHASMAKKGVSLGYVTDLGEQRLPRGKVLYGMARNYLRKVCATGDATWSIQDGQLQIVKVSEYAPNEAVVLTRATGLVGMPEVTLDGIKLKCLLNPRLKAGCKVILDNESINQMAINLNYTAVNAWIPKLDSPDEQYGTYKIIRIEHQGDTRGQEWYSDVICIGVNEALPPSMLQRGAV